MELNNTKCKAMQISRKNTPAQTNYNINGHIIEQVTNLKDLGVVVSKDLSWSQHINSIVSKANKTLGLIKCICKEVKKHQDEKDPILRAGKTKAGICE